MERREILKYTAMATGAAVSMPLLSVVLSGCKTDEVVKEASNLKLFNQTEFEKLKALVDVILPKTDSPSASDVGVHTMIDHMVGYVFTKENKDKFKMGFDAVVKFLDGANDGKGFLNFSALDQLGLVTNLAHLSGTNAEAVDGLKIIKQHTIAYYLLSEEIAENYLNYLPVPGEYQECISLEEAGGKKWAI